MSAAVDARLGAFGLSLCLSLAVVLMHYEGLSLLLRLLRPLRRFGRLQTVFVVCGALVIHVLETVVFAFGYWIGERQLHLGSFVHAHNASNLVYFYFSLETFTTQALGDVYPVGPLRMVASIEPLVGLILIGWTTTFTFLFMRQNWDMGPPAPDRGSDR